MRQTAPDPEALGDLLHRLAYKPGWFFYLEDRDRGQGCVGLTLTIQVRVPDSYAPDKEIVVNHFMPVPPAAFDARSWQRWLFEQILLVEQHEAAEFFRLRDGDELARPYAPSHGPGNDPYMIREVGTAEDAETNYRGERSSARALDPVSF